MSRRIRSLAAIVLAACLGPAAAAAAPKPPLPIYVQAPKSGLRLEVAADPAARERGLMNRTALHPHFGMIFVFAGEQPVTFWMKNTLIPLDMIFVDTDGAVTSIAPDVPATKRTTPNERIPRRAGRAKYVIELNAGEAARDGLVVGTTLHLPPIEAR